MDRPIGTIAASGIDGQRLFQRLGYFRHVANVACLALADICAFFLAAVTVRPSRLEILQHPDFPRLSLQSSAYVYALVVLIFIAVRYLVGDYSRRQLFWDEARQTSSAIALAALTELVLLTVGGAHFSPPKWILNWVFVLFAVPAFRQIARLGMSRLGIWRYPTALVGSGQMALDAFRTFSQSISLGFDVRYVVIDDVDGTVPPQLQSLTPIGLHNPKNIVERLVKEGCIQVVIASEDIEHARIGSLIQRLVAARIGVAIIPVLGKVPLLGLSANYFFDRNLLLLQTRNNLSRLPSRLIKRAFDFVCAAMLLVLLAPVMAAIIFLIKRSDGGPAIFEQPRMGLDGREFNCLKFRTMVADAEDQLKHWERENPSLYREYTESNFKLRDDPRVTPIGRWLRRTSFDELPQLLNVLRGEMSLVGPRPLLSREVGQYGIGFELYRCVRPGLTGLWQISGRSETRFADRVAFDEWYIKNWSLWYDLVILLKTAPVLIEIRGAY